MLSIPKIWNLERNIREFEPKSIFIIIPCGLMDIEKREDGFTGYTHERELELVSISMKMENASVSSTGGANL